MSRHWVNRSIEKIEADFNRSADTHLFHLPLPGHPEIDIYLKDESTHPTGSLKHRLARSLFLYGLCNGWITEGRAIIEASSGSTAVSEAYFARLLGLQFIAVMPKCTSEEKIAQIEFAGGQCHLVSDPTKIQDIALEIVQETGGHFLDQFTFAERATDWRGNNNIAQSLFQQLEKERHPDPRWVVMSAGTGGTSATLGRFIRYQKLHTELCVVDPENSVFYDFFVTGDHSLTCSTGSNIEGIGRPRVEPSFIPSVVDRMLQVPDPASIASILFLERLLGRRVGGSTGTNFYGLCQLISEMSDRGEGGSVVTLICDPGERYLHTYFDEGWRAQKGIDVTPYLEQLENFWFHGVWEPAEQIA